MNVLYFKAELLDDVVLSQRTATVGDHKSLDYIPGSVFLGIAASHFYDDKDSKRSWELFHSSKLRFYNAYPMIAGKRSIPMPLSFHGEKVPRIGKEKSVLNFVYPEIKDVTIQYKQKRDGFINFPEDNDVAVVVPTKTSRMRTAIEGKTGTAAKSQLFGYESLNAGQVFIGKIEWDESIVDTITPLVEFFKRGSTVHAGRSRTASYGRVRVSAIDFSPKIIQKAELKGKTFSVLAISDLCLRNSITGTPELKLIPQFFGLGEHWTLDITRSFSRPSFVYQYNTHRREIEVQKTLVSKGSVFTFESKNEMSSEEKELILSAIVDGIGDARGQGFGEISLFNIEKEFDIVLGQTSACDLKKIELTADEEKWLSWLVPGSLNANIEGKVKEAVIRFVDLCQSIKIFQSFEDEMEFWPKKNQWDRILKQVRECTSKQDLKERLFSGSSPVIKEITVSYTDRNKDTKVSNPDPEWNYKSSPEGMTLREWLLDFINDREFGDREIKVAMQELVKRCKDEICSTSWLKGEGKSQ